MDISELRHGDKILVECTVEAVFVKSGMVMVTTRDCDKGFDAYIDEIKEVQSTQVAALIGVKRGDGIDKGDNRLD